ncbi:hypothetical protein [Clostridium botulinum]|nr:hypothetical protein [Clostridium botulinum]MBE1302901.1 hypothetical protein [Clostridium botulinum]MBY6829219.1 hypothetical protein [Clostridium botulinum]MBY6844843.1 hypothetical protein [Clostridium botulinum]MBY6941467.1 hypothetical protein [Clostridium botulinum]MBY6962338.1 hypothetical protein [Clostridium botulinum]
MGLKKKVKVKATIIATAIVDVDFRGEIQCIDDYEEIEDTLEFEECD